MSLPDFDVAILGGGPVGSALALLLARHAPRPERIALFAAAPGAAASDTTGTAAAASPTVASPTAASATTVPSPGVTHIAATGALLGTAPPDPRVLAMNHGSRVLLESLGAWPAQYADIRTVHVSQAGRLGRTLIRDDDFGVPRLGSVAAYDAVQQALARAVDASGITRIGEPRSRITEHDGQGAIVQTPAADGTPRHWSCALAVQADGSPGPDSLRDYGQHAVLATARASLPRQHWAFERFTREGPLALLPHPQGQGLYSIVWCCGAGQAARLKGLDGAGFSRALEQAFGTRLGRFDAQPPGAALALSTGLRREPVQGRTVRIGNAAQTLHPVAGQGLNLGLRDAARLALALRDWLPDAGTDPAAPLRDYAQAREPDRRLTASVTQLLPRLFATGQPAVEHACGLALLALDLAAPLRAPLARHLLQGLRA